jgi:hypothetical protein
MGVRPPRGIGEFAWQHADIGVECGTCGLIQVYCDFEALARFRERGWSGATDDAVQKFRCRCGSKNVRFRPISIAMRPKPLPVRPAPLRPIYVEDGRTLFRRPSRKFPDEAAIDAAVAVLRRDVDPYKAENLPEDEVRAALAVLRPYCYRQEPLDEFIATARRKDGVFGGQSAQNVFIMILRELGRTE